MLSHKESVECSQTDKNIGPVITGDNVLIDIHRREYSAAHNIGFHEAALPKEELISTTAAVDLKQNMNFDEQIFIETLP